MYPWHPCDPVLWSCFAAVCRMVASTITRDTQEASIALRGGFRGSLGVMEWRPQQTPTRCWCLSRTMIAVISFSPSPPTACHLKTSSYSTPPSCAHQVSLTDYHVIANLLGSSAQLSTATDLHQASLVSMALAAAEQGSVHRDA
jgi:hypothetical protein